MRAWRLHAPAPIESRPLRLEEIARPSPGPDEVLLRVKACGVCRTDLHVLEGELPFLGRPLTLGHQIVGVVEEVGARVTSFARGDRAGVAWLRWTDGTCRYCLRGNENLCESARFTGYHADGGFAEYAVAPAAFSYRLPQPLPDAQVAPLLCAGIVGFRALRRSALAPGQTLGLFGFGSSAHVTMQVARSWGCEIFVATRGETHQRLARELGAAWVGGAYDPLPRKVDSAIVFAPAGELVPAALRAIDKGGTVALAGIHMSDVPAMSYEAHLFYEKNLRSVTANTRDDGRDLLKAAAEIPILPHVQRFAFEELQEALLAVKHDRVTGSAVLVLQE